MKRNQLRIALGAVVSIACWPTVASAQDLMGLDKSALRGEVDRRYSEALAATNDQGVVAADDNRFMWASQAKAQCGIAIGFLKSGIKDPVSVGKCEDAYNRMQQRAPVQAPAPVYAPQPAVACNRGPAIAFFEWDRADLTSDQAASLDSLATTYPGCGGAPVSITGYTDRSGSDRYNLALSQRRAAAVRDYLVSRGVPMSAMTTQGFGESNPRVPTADGVRELQNRRVEITVN